ncbi:unnamed protein product [Caenorhabditis auriculariae]|uniref:Signal recognition particle receptor subunit beta n=1 Tax=Caenorhabditis auriculariae TaxID=2777116 RepID=A0A8S1HW87_9PELO|nr:unnamed protein product [Caenorhabditis auriculariae]
MSLNCFYDIALNTTKKVPILVACHKQDLTLAKSEQVIRSTLEKEIGLVNKSRSAALKGTDGDESRNATLTETGTDFIWTDLSGRKIDFATSAAFDGADVGIDAIRSFVRD